MMTLFLASPFSCFLQIASKPMKVITFFACSFVFLLGSGLGAWGVSSNCAIAKEHAHWNFVKGTQLVYEMKQITNTNIMNPGEKKVLITETVIADLVYKVIDITPEGDGVIQFDITRIRFTNPKMNFDSDSKITPTKTASSSGKKEKRKPIPRYRGVGAKKKNAIARKKELLKEKANSNPVSGLRSILGKPITVVIGVDGKFKKYQAGKEYKSLYASSPMQGEINASKAVDPFVVRCIEPVFIGFPLDESGNSKKIPKNWSRSINFDSPAGEVTAQINYEYSGRTQKEHLNKYVIETKLQIVEGTENKKVQFLPREGGGVLFFDRNTGVFSQRSHRISATLLKTKGKQISRAQLEYKFFLTLDKKRSQIKGASSE